MKTGYNPNNPFRDFSRISTRKIIDVSQHLNPSLSKYKDSEYVVLWYGKIVPKVSNNKLFVDVFLASIHNDYSVTESLPFELIPSIPISSIIKNGKITEQYDIPNQSFIELRDMDYANDATSIETNISYDIVKESDHFALLKSKYRLNRYGFNDFNTLLMVNYPKGSPTNILIHPLVFFNAHYGVSKEVNRVLLSYLWGEKDNDDSILSKIKLERDLGEPSADFSPKQSFANQSLKSYQWVERDNNILPTVSNQLNLYHFNPKNPESVLISNNLTIADAVFLYYLKNDDITYHRVRAINNRVRKNFFMNLHKKNEENKKPNIPYTYLKITPYHTQAIQLQYKGINLDKNTILCTEITGISMPQGKTIYYDTNIKKKVKTDENSNEELAFRYMPLARYISAEEFVVVNETVNNKTVNAIKFKIETLGEIRKVLHHENIGQKELMAGAELIPLPEKKATSFSGGDRIGTSGDIGFLKSIADTQRAYQKNEYGIREADGQYDKLFKYAQHYKDNSGKKVQIDSCKSNSEPLGEKIRPIHLQRKSFPFTVLILRLVIDGEIYYFLDCEASEKYSSSGIAIKGDITDFPKNLTLDKLVIELGQNQGRLPNSYDEFEALDIIARYKHMNEDNSNWVENAIQKLNKK